MKKDIHPKWYPDGEVVCACGHVLKAGLTKPRVEVEVCATCHPFFTGEMKYVDVQGRVEKFQAKQKATAGKKFVKKSDRKRLKRLADEKADQKKPKNLKEMFANQQKKAAQSKKS